MAEIKTKGEGEQEQLDDLLDTILQKNMQEAAMADSGSKALYDADSVKEEMAQKADEAEEPYEAIGEEITADEIITDEEQIIAENEADEALSDDDIPLEDLPEPSQEDDIEVIEMEDSKEEEDDNKLTKKDVLSMIAYVVVIFLMTFFIVHFIGQRTRVSGSSMENTLSNGDNLIVDKISYRLSDPKRFDVIIFPYRFDPETYYIKRIIGLPGETVQIDENGTIFINGEELEEDYGLEQIVDPGVAIEPVVLADDEYFVLGDNRNNSSDSRFSGVGNVKREDIIGRAWIRIYPFDKIKKV